MTCRDSAAFLSPGEVRMIAVLVDHALAHRNAGMTGVVQIA